MSNTVIKVENVAKQYRLGEVGTGSISHDINRWWSKMRGKEDPYLKIGETNDRTTKGNSDYVWALKDINFEVKQGEVLGIIGRNGAGKSTLLKILSRTTLPTTGSIKMKGRIASLLEVGTGFHPDLSGRDNIFLNGAILGMTKNEIKSKFDEIVDFAGIERYIDTPVKRYSSGMYVRLAFGVAAHLEPEILIVDEVLAVGDAEFQKKALGKMKDVSTKGGRTVLFVSHNMAAVSNLCTHGLLMKNGQIEFEGRIDKTIESYLNSGFDKSNIEYIAQEDKLDTQIVSAGLVDTNGKPTETFGHYDDIFIDLCIKNFSDKKGIRCCIAVWDLMETLICVDRKNIPETKGYTTYKIKLPGNLLVSNTFKLGVALDIPGKELIEIMPHGLRFTIEDIGSSAKKYGDSENGLVLININWDIISNG
jgi:lipopolysaccharide transport system ATP-binding protein